MVGSPLQILVSVGSFPVDVGGRRRPGGQERLTRHTSTADTTSIMTVLPVEAKLLVGKILEVHSFTLRFKVSDKRIIKT